MSAQTLKDKLTNWTDIDIAAYYLAQSLGLMGPEVDFAAKAKHVFWSNHEVGNILYDFLAKLATGGILEFRDEPDQQYRWNINFKGSWE